MFTRVLVLAFLSLLTGSVESFSVMKSSPSCSRRMISRSTQVMTSTCLRAEEDKETEARAEEEVKQTENTTSSGTDILNSPAFLKRKVDVLKSDIAKIDEEIEAAKQLLEAGKAEWGPQLDDLQREVSVNSIERCILKRRIYLADLLLFY